MGFLANFKLAETLPFVLISYLKILSYKLKLGLKLFESDLNAVCQRILILLELS